MTVTSLVLQARAAFAGAGGGAGMALANGIVALVLLGLAGTLCGFAAQRLREPVPVRIP